MDDQMQKSDQNVEIKRGFVAVAVTEDKFLAKDYTNWLIARNVQTNLSKSKDPQKSETTYYITVEIEKAEQAVKLIQMRNPEDYFYDSLFYDDEEENSEDIY